MSSNRIIHICYQAVNFPRRWSFSFDETVISEIALSIFLPKWKYIMVENNAKKMKLDDEVPKLKKQLEGVLRERDEVTKQRDKALEENNSLQHVMEVMRSKVECPVCLGMPREAPAMCPRY